MKCITNMYGLNSGDWTLYLRLVQWNKAMTKLNKCSWVSSCRPNMASNESPWSADDMTHVRCILVLMVYVLGIPFLALCWLLGTLLVEVWNYGRSHVEWRSSCIEWHISLGCACKLGTYVWNCSCFWFLLDIRLSVLGIWRACPVLISIWSV